MNIVIVGAGNDPQRFGGYFKQVAEEAEHTVYTFSYRLETTALEDVPVIFELDVLDRIPEGETIDLFLYNSIGGFYPGQPKHYSSLHDVNMYEWQKSILINAAIPHKLSTMALRKMDENSSIVFMTSSASYLINRDNYLEMAGYFGTKGAMNQLMRAMAEYNDKGTTVYTMAPHIPYENPEQARLILKKLTDYILSMNKESNGKILQCYPPDGRIWPHEGGQHP